MIRPFLKADLPAVLSIWLSANQDATHLSLPPTYLALVRELLPQAEILIHESDPGQSDGFIGLSDSLIEGLFVARSARFHGVGRQLLNAAKEEKSFRLFKEKPSSV